MSLSEAKLYLPVTSISPRMTESHAEALHHIRPGDFASLSGWRQTEKPTGWGRHELVMTNNDVANRAVDTELVFSDGLLTKRLKSFYQTATGENVTAFVAQMNDTRKWKKNPEETAETLTCNITYKPKTDDGYAFVELNHEEQFSHATAWSSVIVRLREGQAAQVLDQNDTKAQVDVVVNNTVEGPVYSLRIVGENGVSTTQEIQPEEFEARGIQLPDIVFLPTGVSVKTGNIDLQIDTISLAKHAKTRLQRNSFITTMVALEDGHSLFRSRPH